MKFVAENSVELTRTTLANNTDGVPVVGWVDLTSPNLVDLIDELQHGPGGQDLVALRCSLDDLNDLCATRGLACLERAGLALYADDAGVIAQAEKMFPRLNVMTPD